MKFVLGSVLGAAAVLVLLVIGGFVLYSMRDQVNTANLPVNSNNNSNITNIANLDSPTKKPSPRKPSPSPTAAKLNENTGTKTTDRECKITNPTGGTVNLRRDCDTRDCSLDASTLYTQADPGDKVVPTGRATVTTGDFTWVQVRYHGETLWISSTRMACE